MARPTEADGTGISGLKMTIRNLDRLMAPRSIVLVGASEQPGSVGEVVTRNILKAGFDGEIWLVNPRRGSALGVPCHSSVESLPGVPDLAVVVTPPSTVPGVIDELGRKGCRAAVVISAGIRGELRNEMLKAAGRHLLRIVGPNCLGLMLPPLGVDASFSHIAPIPGTLAFLSQSGALITGVIDWATSRGIGFSHIVSMGDMADVDAGDLLDYLAGDPASKAILMYLESLTEAPKFMSAARRASRSKPVIVIKSGRHARGAAAAMSHTGALAGADFAFEAAFRRAGILRVHELGELFSAAEILSKVPGLNGERLALITNGGGAGVLATDRLGDLGLEPAVLSSKTIAVLDKVLPPTWSRGNPIDIIGDAHADRFAAAVSAALDDPNVDAALVLNCPTALSPSLEAAKAVTAVQEKRKAEGKAAKPILTNWLGTTAAAESRCHFAEKGIPTFDTPADAIGAFGELVRHRRAQSELMATPPSLPDAIFKDGEIASKIIDDALSAGHEMMTEFEAKALLRAYGIPTVDTEIAASPEDVERIAARLIAEHGACVLKILSLDITHKSDVGGVRLGLDTAEEARTAAETMLARIRELKPTARIDGFTVQPMIRRARAHELLLGVSIDRTFGPLVTFGAGGVAVEAVRDVAHALPPLDANLARDLMRHTRIWRLLQGYRDRPAAAIDEIALTLVKLGYLVARHKEIREIDINPLLADENGVIALDARVRIVSEKHEPRTPLAIRPYPSEWETRRQIGKLGEVFIRPIRPEDEVLYSDFFAKIDAKDIRMRFFSTKANLTHRLLARLTQIDYAREMAFAALDPRDGRLLGVARFIADPDFVAGEYGVLVRSDLKGQGLGWALMSHLIEYAKSSGLKRIFGHILHENDTMISMCRELGFEMTVDNDDPALMRATLDIGSVADQTPHRQ